MYKINDKKLLYMVVLVILVGLILPITFSVYNNKVNVDVVTKTGKLVCDFDIDVNDNYVDNKGKYFYIEVFNYEEGRDEVYLTDTDVDYKLIITNSNSDISYSYNNVNKSTIEITNSFDNKKKDKTKYKIYLINNGISKIESDINVKLEANQKID